MSCRSLLEPDAIACVECGVKIGETGTQAHTGISLDASAVPAARNTLSFQEDKNNRRFEASLTDAAMHSLGGVFGDLFAQRSVVRLPSQIAGTSARQAPVIEAATLAISPAVEKPDVLDVLPVTPSPANPNSDKGNVTAFFSSNGEKLELIDNRLKASSGADYLRQLTYLFLYAHELHGRLSVPERDLNIMLTAAKMMDESGNTRKWLRARVGIGDEGEGNVKLNNVGRDAAKKTLRDALDTNLVASWNPDSAASKPKATKSSKVKGKAKA